MRDTRMSQHIALRTNSDALTQYINITPSLIIVVHYKSCSHRAHCITDHVAVSLIETECQEPHCNLYSPTLFILQKARERIR